MGRRKRPEINASSMADIAFLLLIFFLVTTTMDIDRGILVTLPPWSPDVEEPETKAKKRETLEILVNARDQLLVEGSLMDVKDLKDEVIKHVANNGRLENYSSSPTDAIVSLKNDKGTSYNMYIQVYDAIRAGYNKLRNDEANRKFGRDYSNLVKEQQKEIRKTYPLQLSEAEPADYSAEGS